MRVLYVEDDPMNQQVVKDMLQVAGAAMVGAPDAESGLRMAEEQEFEVVLMDIRMPGMDGLTAIEHLRRKSHPVSSVPVIVVTADTSSDLHERCKAVDADEVIMKPVALQELIGSMGRVLARKASAGVMLD
ncbi:MAG: response regulator [Pseudomonadota bacterium]